jgi:hypothetical protein
MTQLRFVPAVFAASAVFLLAPLASALVAPVGDPTTPTCATNADCGRGYECTVVGGSGCASAACAPGASCPPPEPCTPTETRACTPAHCAVDADCADGMVCHEWIQPGNATDCFCPPDAMGCNCGTQTPPTAISLCTPPYVLPCATAADCGDGFNCEEQPNCVCATSGGAPTPPAPGGAAGASSSDPIDPTPACECGAPSMACVTKEVVCQTAAQCLPGWSCQPDAIASAPACAGPDCPPAPAPMPARSLCRPPYYGAQSGTDLQVPGVPTSGTGTGTTTGSGKGTGTAGTGTNPGSPEASSGSGEAHESSACQLGHAPASRGAFSLLLVLGALFGLQRRRR